jgi:hypothetical protein
VLRMAKAVRDHREADPCNGGDRGGPITHGDLYTCLSLLFSMPAEPVEVLSWLDSREFSVLVDDLSRSKRDRRWPERFVALNPWGGRADGEVNPRLRKVRDLWNPDFALVYRTAERLGLPVLEKEAVHDLLGSLIHKVSPSVRGLPPQQDA